MFKNLVYHGVRWFVYMVNGFRVLMPCRGYSWLGFRFYSAAVLERVNLLLNLKP